MTTNIEIVVLSHALSATTPLYGGAEHGVVISKLKSLNCGDHCESREIKMPNHAGTHVDAPAHFIAGGAMITDLSPASYVFTRCALFDILTEEASLICADQLYRPLFGGESDTEFLFLRTGFESKRDDKVYWERNPGLSPGLSIELQKRWPKLRALGMDFISTSSFQHREAGRIAHREFLSAGILLYEDMKLSTLQKRPQIVVGAPLWANDLDAAPATVFALYL